MISKAALKLAVNSLHNRKAPGLDGILAEALKATMRVCPQFLLDMYNRCLKQTFANSGRFRGWFSSATERETQTLPAHTGHYACWISQARFSKRSLGLDCRAQSRLPVDFLSGSSAFARALNDRRC